MLANLHDTFKISTPTGQQTVSTDIPEDIKKFYTDNQIDFKYFSELQKQSIQKWGIKEKEIIREMDR